MECRFCRTKSPNNNIFELKLKIFHVIEQMLKINKEDVLPKLICSICVNRLETIEKFIRQCEDGDAYFRNNITLPIKQEPEFPTSEYETYTDIAVRQMKREHTVCNEESLMDYSAGNENEIKIEYPDFSENSPNDSITKTGQSVQIDDYVQNTVKKKVNRLKCPHCASSYKVLAHLKRHIKVHDFAKVFRCEFCKMVYASRRSLRRHHEKFHNDKVLRNFNEKLTFVKLQNGLILKPDDNGDTFNSKIQSVEGNGESYSWMITDNLRERK